MKIEELWALVEKYDPENMGYYDHIQKHDGRGHAISFWLPHRWPDSIEFSTGDAHYYKAGWLFESEVANLSISGPGNVPGGKIRAFVPNPDGDYPIYRNVPKDTPLEEIFGEDIVALFQLLR